MVESASRKLHNVLSDNGKEKYILFAVSYGDEEKAEKSIEELEELLETAGGESVAFMVQNLEKPDRTTYIGKGKALELKEMVEFLDADGVICDDELTPSQHRNLSQLLDTKVVDRTMLILDIFAGRATTGEGKIQVEMAQLKYRASRLTGQGTFLSRLGGGIGTRGPGETKLETDRRAIQRRLDKLTADVKSLKQVRETTRKKRLESSAPIVAIVGYTNAGKSTLLNRLTSADILAEDKLFATLDPTTRVCRLESGREILFTDTVGFINKLPHQLIDAFRSTLEEAKYADVILHLVDGTSSDMELHKEVVYDTLENMGIKEKPIITAFNKVDLIEDADELPLMDENADLVLEISAKTGKGLDELFEAIEGALRGDKVYLEIVIPYGESEYLKRIKKYGELISEEYVGDGVLIKAYVPHNLLNR